jgi:hypothetical protein
MSLRWTMWIPRAPTRALPTIRKILRCKIALSTQRDNQNAWTRPLTKTTRIVSAQPISITGTFQVILKSLRQSSIKSQLRPSPAFYLNKALI